MSDAAINLPGAQTGDVDAAAAGRDFHQYQGISFDQVAQLLARFLDKEPQRRELEIAAIKAGMRATDDRLDRHFGRIATILIWIAGILAAEAIALSLLLLVVLSTLFTVLQPYLIARGL